MNLRPLLPTLLLFLISKSLMPASDLVVSYTIERKPKDIIDLPTTVIKKSQEGQQQTLELTEELRYLTGWNPPELPPKPSLPVTPMSPTQFEVFHSGWVIQFTAEPVKEGLVRIIGRATCSTPETTQGVYGEHSGPIYAPTDKTAILTPNVAETLITHTTSTPFQVFAIPGKSYVVKIKDSDKEMKLHVTCDYRTAKEGR